MSLRSDSDEAIRGPSGLSRDVDYSERGKPITRTRRLSKRANSSAKTHSLQATPDLVFAQSIGSGTEWSFSTSISEREAEGSRVE